MSARSSSAERRRTFKPFAQAPRDGTPFNVAYIARYNPFAKTFELLKTDRYNGESVWQPEPIAHYRFFCDLIPPRIELPTSFEMTFIATPVRLTLRQRFTRYLSRLLAKVRP
jgi:hypothetical protein